MKTIRKIGKKSRLSGVKGFTLIELMIVIAIVALLVTLAMPSYKQFVRKSKRGEAQQMLMNWANLQEIWRSNHPLYAPIAAAPTGIPAPVHPDGVYTFSLTVQTPPTATEYTLTATATGDQLKDKQAGVICSPMSITQANARTPAACW